jgi:hypothetical protein
MRLPNAAIAVLVGVLATTAPALADSVAVASGPNGSVIVNGQPCRVVTTHDGRGSTTTSNSTSITAGPNGVSGSTTVSPGNGSGSSVIVGNGSSSNGAQSSSAGGSDCVIYRHKK